MVPHRRAVESGRARIANAPLDLSAGDYLFFDANVEAPDPGQDIYLQAQRETIRRACERFDCVAVETWWHYRAVRLESKHAGPGSAGDPREGGRP